MRSDREWAIVLPEIVMKHCMYSAASDLGLRRSAAEAREKLLASNLSQAPGPVVSTDAQARLFARALKVPRADRAAWLKANSTEQTRWALGCIWMATLSRTICMGTLLVPLQWNVHLVHATKGRSWKAIEEPEDYEKYRHLPRLTPATMRRWPALKGDLDLAHYLLNWLRENGIPTYEYGRPMHRFRIEQPKDE